MRRDYAKTQRYYRTKRRSSGWLLLMGVLLGAGIVGSAFFYRTQIAELPALSAFQKKEVKKVEKASKSAASKVVTAPRFDFYTLLPQDEVAVPDGREKSNPKTTSAPQKLAEKSLGQEGRTTWVNPNVSAAQKQTEKKLFYYLQAGVFTHYSEADRLKARLGLMGQPSSIKVEQQNGLKTYRVVLGPFGNRTTASVKQNELSKNQISSFVIGDAQ